MGITEDELQEAHVRGEFDVDELVRRVGVDDEQDEPGRVEIERHLLGVVRQRVEA